MNYFKSRNLDWLKKSLINYRDLGRIDFKTEDLLTIPESTAHKKDKLYLTAVALGLIKKNRDFVSMSSEEFEAEWELKEELKGKDLVSVLGPFYPIKMHFLLEEGCPLSVSQEEDEIVIRTQGDGTLLLVCEENVCHIQEYRISPLKGSLIYTGKQIVECEEDLCVNYLPPQLKLSPSISLMGEKSLLENCFEITYKEIHPKRAWVKQSEFQMLKNNPMDLVLLKLCIDSYLENSNRGAGAYVSFAGDRDSFYTEQFSMPYLVNIGDDQLSLDEYHFQFEDNSLVFYNTYRDRSDHLISARIEVELFDDDELVDDLIGVLFPKDLWGYSQLFDDLEHLKQKLKKSKPVSKKLEDLAEDAIKATEKLNEEMKKLFDADAYVDDLDIYTETVQLKKTVEQAGLSLKDIMSRFEMFDTLIKERELKK